MSFHRIDTQEPPPTWFDMVVEVQTNRYFVREPRNPDENRYEVLCLDGFEKTQGGCAGIYRVVRDYLNREDAIMICILLNAGKMEDSEAIPVFDPENPKSVHIPLEEFPSGGIDAIYRIGEAFPGYCVWDDWVKGDLKLRDSIFYNCEMIAPGGWQGGHGFSYWSPKAKMYFRTEENNEHCLQIGAVLVNHGQSKGEVE